MDPHGIKILDRANDNDVADVVTQQFKFKLLPAQDALFDEHLVYRRSVEAAVQRVVKLLRVVNEAATGSAQCVGRSDYKRETDFLSDLLALQERRGRGAAADANAEFLHFQPEFLAIFGCLDGVDVHTNYPHPVMLPQTCFLALDTEIQRSLAAHCGQYGVDVMFFQNG